MEEILENKKPRTPSPELLTEAAGVKIFMTPLREDIQDPQIDSSATGKVTVALEVVKTRKGSGKSCGFHLTKSKWDPYPWVSYVETGSLADTAGIRAGDCLIGVEGKDLLGLKVKQIATLIQSHECSNVQLSLWRHPNGENESKQTGLALKGPLPDVTSRLVNAVSGAVRILECPVCLESSMPPVSQCVHGHIICVGCRPKTSRCPVCRVRLGQGRCLLADKLHRIFRDVFGVKDDSSNNAESETSSLRDKLFGKGKKKQSISSTVKHIDTVSKPRRLLLARLLLGGLEKAASADNLTTVSESINEAPTTSETARINPNFNERLNSHDRIKSASTGELSSDAENQRKNVPLTNDTTNSVASSATSLICSTPHTPTWGGSVDSVFCIQITCPLLKQAACNDIVTPGTLLEHLNRTHEVPQVHFYSGNAKIPLPLPFGDNALYALHYSGDIFFFQCEQEMAWISCTTNTNNSWEWILHGTGKDGAELKLRRTVASLEYPFTLSAEHTAPLPNGFLLHTLNIQLLECRSHDKVNV